MQSCTAFSSSLTLVPFYVTTDLLGIVFGILAATCWGFSAVLVRFGLQHLRPTTGTWISLIPGVVLVMGLALVFNRDAFPALTVVAFLWFALSGLFNFALGRLFNTFSIQLAGVARATPLFSTAPLFATILAVLFLGESVTPWLLLGTVTIVGGIVLITSEQVR